MANRKKTNEEINEKMIDKLAEKYADDKMSFEDVLRMCELFNDEYASLLLRACSIYSHKKFEEDFRTKELNNPIRNKLYRYLKKQ